MPFELWLSFFFVTLVAVFSPGPAVLLAVTHGAQVGAKRAAVPILGNVTGLAIIITASAVGIGSVLQASSDLFFWLKIVGGLYLIFLGIKLLRSGFKAEAFATDGPVVSASLGKTYLQGIGVALSNPKALLLIGAMFSQFLDVSQPLTPQLMILGLTLMTLSFSALMIYATVSKKLISKSRKAVFGRVNKITGTLFVLFGVALAAGSR